MFLQFRLSLIPLLVFSPFILSVHLDRMMSFETVTGKNDTLESRVFTVAAVGDMMFGTSFPSSKYLPPHDNPSLLLGSLADSLRSADITFGNLEGSFLDSGEPVKRCRDSNLCYLFRMPERYSQVLGYAGFDFVSLANNHFGDFGWPAAVKTKQLLQNQNIGFAGSPGSDYSITVKDSVKFGFCAFSPTAGAIDINDAKKTEEVVKFLAAECDIVIVSFHGGAEGKDYQRVPKTNEYFHGENRGNVYDFSHRMIDAGADIVLGHGPHVTRAVELYRDRFIIYSLGNFCTYGRFNILGPNGIAPLMKIKIDKTGKFVGGRIVPVYQNNEGVKYDPAGRVIEKIRELTSVDFPETRLQITKEGNIFIKK